MQVVMQVIARAKDQDSLRQIIISDTRLDNFGLVVSEKQNPTRSDGWSKIHTRKSTNALNLSWDKETKTLTCRFITKSNSYPNEMVGDFVSYLIKHHKRKIKAILIVP